MSVKAMAYVWETPYKGAQKLMLLAIADRCDDEGTCFPGVDKLAKKCSVERRAAQMMITQLEELGEIVVMFNNGVETGHGKTNRYYMKAYRDRLGISTPVAAPRKKKGVQSAASQENRGMQSTTRQGVQSFASQGVQSAASNTSVDTTGDTTVLLPVADATGETADLSHTHNTVQEADETNGVSLQGKTLSASAEKVITPAVSPSPLMQKPSTAEDVKAPSPKVAPAPLPQGEASKPKGKGKAAPASKNKSGFTVEENRAMVTALEEAWGIKAAESEYGLYLKKAQGLVKDGVPMEEFKAFCNWRRKQAGDFASKIRIGSLTGNGHVGAYLAHRAKKQSSMESKGQPQAESFTDAPVPQYHKPAELIKTGEVNQEVIDIFKGVS